MSPIIVKQNKSDFKPAPEGLHQAACVDVVDLGLKDTPWGQKPKIRLWWQIEARDEDGKRFAVAKDYTASLSTKANLTRDLESWRGRPFTEQELEGFDVESCLGANCQVQVAHNLGKNGTVWANVMAVVPIGKGMTKMRAEDFTRVKDRDTAGNGQGEAFEAEDSDVPF
jgi:hypothetical protein